MNLYMYVYRSILMSRYASKFMFCIIDRKDSLSFSITTDFYTGCPIIIVSSLVCADRAS